MEYGSTRRAAAQDSLAGKEDVQPVTIQGPGIMNPRGTAQQPTAHQSVTDQVTQSLLGWGAEKLQVAANTRNQKDQLAGQMAYQQDKTLDDVDMGGNKFALEGYRFMDAQTLSSTLLAAQREEISLRGHTMSPEEYREQYSTRLESMIQDKDPRTADLVREQMTSHMPTLVADHTAQHMRYKEGQNFDSLERSIDVISRDPTATEALVDFAVGGEGSASSGLSDERRQSAVVSGVVRAFENDNPLAYSALAGRGLLGDSLTADQLNSIRAAQKSFEGRRRSEYNEVLFNGEQALMRQVEQGMSPSAAVEELSVLYAEHDINMTQAEAGAVYSQALSTERTNNQTSSVLLEDARLRGDYDTTARITESIMVEHESGGDPYAVSPVGARGTHQVMDDTNRDPGFGITPARDGSAAERARVGSDYWRAMHHRYKGDLEAVAIAYNAGPANADKWLAAGRDDSALPMPEETRPYADKIMADAQDWRAPTAQDKLRLASERLTTTRERMALDTYEQIAPVLQDVDEKFTRGTINREEWKEARDAAFNEYNVARSRADINQELAVTSGVSEALYKESQKVATDEAATAYRTNLDNANAAILGQRAIYEAVVNDPAATPQEMAAATQVYRQAREATFQEYGIEVADQQNTRANEGMYKQLQDGIERNRVWTEEGVEIEAAVNGGYLADLPKKQQRRAFDQAVGNIVKEHTEAVNAGHMTDSEANAAIAGDINAFYAQSGTVDPRVASRMSSAVMGPLLDSDGNPSPAVVDAISQYAEVKTMNPRAAAKFLDPEASAIAAAVLARADDPSLIPEAVRNLGIEMSNSARIEDSDAYMARPDVQRAIDRETKHYLEERDIGLLHALWQDDATLDQRRDIRGEDRDRLWTEESRETVRNELATEVARLQRINPNLRARDLVAEASERLTRRMEVIGGDLVPLAPGQDFGDMFFGGKANDFDHDGAINSAVINWLRSPEVMDQYGFIDTITAAETLPGWVQGAANGVASLFGGEFAPGMSTVDAIRTARTGFRPLQAYPTADGKGLAVSILMPDGNYSEPIVVPAREAGELYMQRRQSENSD